MDISLNTLNALEKLLDEQQIAKTNYFIALEQIQNDSESAIKSDSKQGYIPFDSYKRIKLDPKYKDADFLLLESTFLTAKQKVLDFVDCFSKV